MDHGKHQLTRSDSTTSGVETQGHAASVLVLIVDDERPIAAVIAALIEDLGYQVGVAAHGQQTLELAQAAWPALVITDLMMPKLTGADLIGALRVEAATHGRAYVPVILMTAAGLEQARQAGADAVLSKPFDLNELERLVRRGLPELHGGKT